MSSLTQMQVQALRSVLSSNLNLPLARTPQPFQFLSDTEIHNFFELLREFPEKHGRLTSAIARITGLRHEKPIDYTVLESHIDLNTTSRESEAALITIGFEPDHFFRLYPECYAAHYTLQFLVPTGNAARANLLHTELVTRTQAALDIVGRNPVLFGYLETEVYVNKASRQSGPNVELNQESLRIIESIFGNWKLNRWEVSNNEHISTEHELPANTVKSADLHVKIRHPDMISETEQKDLHLQLGQILEGASLYEIVSEAGNAIYTGQFLTPTIPKAICLSIVESLNRRAAPISVVWEPCSGFWRFGRVANDASVSTLPPIPPILIPAR